MGLYAQETAQTELEVSVKLIKEERIEENEIILPNGEKRILYASRKEYNSVLGPRRGEGFTKGWYSKNGKYVGFADFVGSDTKFTLLNADKQIIWQKEIDKQVICAYISNSGEITILYVGWFDESVYDRVEIRNSKGELLAEVTVIEKGTWAAFSKTEESFGLFAGNYFKLFSNEGELIWDLSTEQQNFVVSDDGNYAAFFSPYSQPSSIEGITFVRRGEVVKHHPISLSPYGGANGYVSPTDDYVLLTDRGTSYLFDFKSGDLSWQKTIGNCRWAKWLGDLCLMVIDSSNTRILKLLNTQGNILFEKYLDEISQEDSRNFKYWANFLEIGEDSEELFLILPPKLYILDIQKERG